MKKLKIVTNFHLTFFEVVNSYFSFKNEAPSHLIQTWDFFVRKPNQMTKPMPNNSSTVFDSDVNHFVDVIRVRKLVTALNLDTT